ncbi:DEAD/DEAH box helicase [Candidatus Poriferisocius sp.]|uniref:DEAD/DEAH box helicase n=1 Tax=Candidatus Poriferisocius sp. TaxID=3101276 RepID=UPI003B5C34A9
MPPTFAQLGVPESICRALKRNGIHKPFEIQAAVIADAMEGRDICGRAPTGSGKTLAFGIPLIANVGQARPRRPRALILSPTRELADQIASELRSISGPITVEAVYGGVGYANQRKKLQRGVDILVACPGRLEDLIDQRAVSLHEVDQVVIDEADRMADMGFLPAVRRILDQTASQRQTVMFSATLDRDVAKLTRDYQHRPITHEIGDATPDIKAADHRFWTVDKTERVAVCVDAVTDAGPTIVFCRTRHGSDRLARQLAQRGVKAAAIHGGHAQNRRTRTLKEFIDGRVEALIATDVAARGIHVDSVACVIHFDPPEDHKAYLHRSGRTARAGQTGLVVSLVQNGQHADAKKIQQQLGLHEPITSPRRLEHSTAPARRRNPAQHRQKGRKPRSRASSR